MSFRRDQLHVIAVVHNPQRFASRDRLFQNFLRHMEESGVSLTLVEAAFGDRAHQHTEHEHRQHVRVRQYDELWGKEAMINVGLSRLPLGVEYVAWIDGDIAFQRPDWAVETIHQLQHYPVVQMFQHAVDMGPTGEVMQTFNSFGYSYAAGLPKVIVAGDAYGAKGVKGAFWHPGFAWAARMEAIDHLGGLIDWSILGSADHIMATALIGEVGRAIPARGLHPNFMKHARLWQERAETHVRRNIGYVPGTILHHWHGKKRDRRYVERWDVLTKHQFDPEQDIKRDHHGMIRLSHGAVRMRDDLRNYFRSRNEDSTDLE